MVGISKIGFTGDLLNNVSANVNKVPEKETKIEVKSDVIQEEPAKADKKGEKKPKEKIVYVSKNPDRAVSATGVVAGTGGMLGGAVLGGLVGVSKLPGEYIRTLAGQDYARIVSDSANGFKTAIQNSPEMQNFMQTLRSAKSPQVAEEILNIAGTMSERLHGAFANDPHASAVIDKVLDPIIKGVSVKKNIRNYGSGVRGQIKSPVGQTIMKFLGFNKKSSKIIGSVAGNFAEGFAKAIDNIRNFTPEEKQAWSKVAKQMFAEFENNPKIKVSKDMLKAIGGFGKDFKWFTEPFKAMQEAILNGIKRLDKCLGMAPVKTVGKWSAIGALSTAAVSVLGWLGLKKLIMKKETTKTQNTEA